MPETVGSGVSFLDYDNDGRLDILFVNSTDWPNSKVRAKHMPALYHNMGEGRFEDVTLKAGLALDVYGMGAAIGDFDNDGYADIYLTCLGPNHLFRNRGNGTFEEVTRKAGVAGVPVEPGGLTWKWSSSACFCDYNRDGIPDLFVCNYVRWTPETDVYCRSRSGKKSYCPPTHYEGAPNTLYRGRGDGTFENVSRETGILNFSGKGFGVVDIDINGDGWTDFVVANDTYANFVFLNEGGRRFREAGVASGIAYAETGAPKAGMGIDTADYKGTGYPGLVIGNFSKECLSLYENDGNGVFRDEAYPAGVAEPSLQSLTFGVCFFDYDLDGFPDILAANGHIDTFVNESDSMITYEQRVLLYHNEGGRFREVGSAGGPSMQIKLVGRGLAWGDIDNDGAPDVALLSNNGKAYLWRNTTAGRGNWLGIRLEGAKCRDAWGAVVKVTAAGHTRTYYRYGGGSFLSCSQPWILAGIGAAAKADRVEVQWPDGRKQVWDNVEAGRYYLGKEGAPLAAVSTHSR
jgi:hypothetical protein